MLVLWCMLWLLLQETLGADAYYQRLSISLAIHVDWFRPIKSHSGARGNIFVVPPNIFVGPLWGENFLNFFFKMMHYGALYIFGRLQGPKPCVVRGSSPLLPHPLDGLKLVVSWGLVEITDVRWHSDIACPWCAGPVPMARYCLACTVDWSFPSRRKPCSCLLLACTLLSTFCLWAENYEDSMIPLRWFVLSLAQTVSDGWKSWSVGWVVQKCFQLFSVQS